MRLTLKVWRQKNAQDPGRFVTYEVTDVSTDMSFLEMLDVRQRGPDRRRARSRSPSTTTAVRASAACAAW